MQTCLEFLQCLPLEATSADEACASGGKNRYAILNIPWRNSALRYLFRVLDRLHLSTRFNDAGQPNRGAFPHVRVPSDRVDTASPIAALPSNVYNQEYLRNHILRLDLFSAKPPVSIYLSREIMRCVDLSIFFDETRIVNRIIDYRRSSIGLMGHWTNLCLPIILRYKNTKIRHIF